MQSWIEFCKLEFGPCTGRDGTHGGGSALMIGLTEDLSAASSPVDPCRYGATGRAAARRSGMPVAAGGGTVRSVPVDGGGQVYRPAGAGGWSSCWRPSGPASATCRPTPLGFLPLGLRRRPASRDSRPALGADRPSDASPRSPEAGTSL